MRKAGGSLERWQGRGEGSDQENVVRNESGEVSKIFAFLKRKIRIVVSTSHPYSENQRRNVHKTVCNPSSPGQRQCARRCALAADFGLLLHEQNALQKLYALMSLLSQSQGISDIVYL